MDANFFLLRFSVRMVTVEKEVSVTISICFLIIRNVAKCSYSSLSLLCDVIVSNLHLKICYVVVVESFISD